VPQPARDAVTLKTLTRVGNRAMIYKLKKLRGGCLFALFRLPSHNVTS
jgi:hypothetical protein